MGAIAGIVMLDESAVAIVLTEIRNEFGASTATTNWVLTAYLLSLTATVAAFGRLADVVGLKALALGGSLVFGIASVGAGLAEDIRWLIFLRVVQGLGAAAAFPTAAAIVRKVTPANELGKALGYFGLATAIGLALGPTVGGYLAESWSWRYVFFLAVPIVAFVCAVLITSYRDEPVAHATEHSFDWLGFALLAVLLGALIGGLMRGPASGWTSVSSISIFSVALAAGMGFVWLERGRANPVVEVGLFRDPTFLSANGVILMAQFAKTAVIVYGPYYLIDILGYSPFRAGNMIVPGIVVAMFTGPNMGRVIDRVGARRPALVGLGVLAAALFGISFATDARNPVLIVVALLFWGYGATTLFAASRRAAQGAVVAEKAGQASGIGATAQWLGAAVAVPVLGIFIHSEPHYSLLYLFAGVLTVFAAIVAWAMFLRDEAH